MKKILLIAAVAGFISASAQTPCVDGMAGIYPCKHMDLLAYMPLNAIGGGENTNDIWGWKSPVSGREYALVGCSNGTAFVDITHPIEPVYLGLLPTHSTNSLWRDLESYDHYCFIGSEAPTHGLQVFDLLQLDDVTEPPVTFSETAHYDGFGNSHTINIDQQNGYLYAMGTQTFSGGLHIVDISDPLNPTLAGGFAEDGYTHDGFVMEYDGPDEDWAGREIVVACNADALTIVDVEDKSDCQYISTLDYPLLGYVHQGWFTKDHRYFLLDDELDEQDFTLQTRTHMFDLVDLDNPLYMGSFTYENISIDHNLYVLDQFVYASNYRSGVRVLDASRTFNTELTEIGYFDLFPTNDLPFFSGTWSNYPFLPSGVNIATSMYDGFFIIKPRLVDMPEEVVPVCGTGSFTISIHADLYFPLTVSVAGQNEGAIASAAEITGPGIYTIELSGSWNNGAATLLLTTNFGTDYEFPFQVEQCDFIPETENTALHIQPNPAENEVAISGLKTGSLLTFYNALGQITDERKVPAGALRINVDAFAPGIYTVKTSDGKSGRMIVR